MQEASRVINILTKYKIENNEHLASVTLTDYAKMGALSEQLNSLNTQIEDLSLKIKKPPEKFRNSSLLLTKLKRFQDVKNPGLKKSISLKFPHIIRI